MKELNAKIHPMFSINNKTTFFCGDCVDLLKQIPDESVDLVITSPPYNIGKEYEKKIDIEQYVLQQTEIINECVRTIKDSGSICWQVGNYVNKGSIIPLDSLLFPIFLNAKLKMRNRIVWHFEHGLHCKNRFSGRYETIVWFTKTDNYKFNLDPVRVPQKYPKKKYFKGPKAGQYSCNPLGKNPGDLWIFPNVKHNHVEKTIHPCQFPVELAERLVLSLTDKNDLVLDPFAGVGTTAVAAIKNKRKSANAETKKEYFEIAQKRIVLASQGKLPIRSMNKSIYNPDENLLKNKNPDQTTIFDMENV